MKTNKKEKENKRYRYGQTALHILVLNSPTTNCAQLRSAIESEKCKVSVVSTAHPEEWSNLDLRAFNVIVYAPDDRTVLDNAFQRRVKTFVYEGGGLVLFEWVAFHIEHRRLTHWADFVPIQRYVLLSLSPLSLSFDSTRNHVYIPSLCFVLTKNMIDTTEEDQG